MSEAEIAACGAKELTAKQWLQLAQQAAEAGTLYLTLTGGEPLVRDDFEEIYTGLSAMGFRLSLNTNGSLITPKNERLFSKLPPRSILVTLYGADAETYRNVCSNPAAFDNVIKGLGFAASLPSKLEIRATFITDNKDQHKQMRELAQRYGCDLIVNPFVNMPAPGVSADVGSCRLSASDCIDILEEYAANNDALRNTGDPVMTSVSNAIDGLSLSGPGERDRRSDVYPGILSCNAAKSMYHIKWDGKMYPCISFLSPYTLPQKEGFREAWDRLPDLLKDLRRPKKCSNCVYSDKCDVCPARVEAETGSFDEAPGYICEIVKEMVARIK